jgi:putative intracellular protease/amidase
MRELKVAIIIPPREFKDETVSRLGLMLSKKDIGNSVASITLKECTGYHGAVVKPDAELIELDPTQIDALVLADGPGVDTLKMYEYRPLLDLIKTFYERNKLIAGIGNGIKIVARANIIKDVKIASVNRENDQLVMLYRGLISENYLVLDKNILTLSNPEKIEEFVTRLSEGLKNVSAKPA